jgi:hypothetical protein
MVDAVAPPNGCYTDEAVVALLDDGRRVRVVNHFGYVDRHGLRWDVPAGAIVDGASIPRPLWSVIGGPFEGKYRAASIVHDWFCDVRSRLWKSVHRMFFEAMLASGVPAPQAKLMYAGVYWGGPRWSQTAVDNMQLILNQYLQASAGPHGRVFHARDLGASEDSAAVEGLCQDRSYRYEFNGKDVNELAKLTAAQDLTLEELEGLVDEQLTKLSYSEF